jgi:hypothetical protein
MVFLNNCTLNGRLPNGGHVIYHYLNEGRNKIERQRAWEREREREREWERAPHVFEQRK